jgi:5-formyltetrahydrofolate cyclo-ligase
VTPGYAGSAAAAVARWVLLDLAERRPRFVALYASLPDELGMRPLFEALVMRGIAPVLPRMVGERIEFAQVRSWSDLHASSRGLLEPARGVATKRLGRGDVAIVPGVAFDRAGHRLGRGGGSYDRAFGTAAAAPFLIGAGYAFQLRPSVPHESRDRSLDAIVTESGFVWPRGHR